MADVALALLWHQHQPYYPDDFGRETLMPWVRLHGVKDYYGMALHLDEVPEMQCTINLVPSLVEQLERYTQGQGSDRHLEISRIPADGLTEEQCHFLLNEFFMANPTHMIRPHPRYFELYHRRDLGRCTAADALRRFAEKDLRDLQVWFNLAWVHPLAVAQEPALAELVLKGKHFTEEDKNVLLDKHLEILKRILPLHRRLAERGQVELTTTPYFHPILPLLLDKRSAREAQPEARLPRFLAPYPEDAQWHVQEAVKLHEQVFGVRPRGMWPAEGSVCQSMVPLLSAAGIRWIATDEEILSQSTNGLVRRDSRGFVVNAEHLYQPYRVVESGAELSVVFRDHALSDLIGFHYQRSDGAPAAEDFVGKLTTLGQALAGPGPALVSVILDGENCWEHYPGGGVEFLRGLYHRCVRTAGITPVRLGDFLERHPPRSTLPRLFSGSWIHHNFDIWIGHEEDNIAWDLLHQTREHLRLREQQGMAAPEVRRRAWRELYISEGSDWFWWYGPHHTSPQDGMFDYLFRKHLQNVYLALDESPPAELARPINRRASRPLFTPPRSFLDVTVNGRKMPIEWMGAGRYVPQNERGTMAIAAPGPIAGLQFGFTPQRLLIRLDLDGPARKVLTGFDAIRVGFAEPPGCELLVHNPSGEKPDVLLNRPGGPVTGPGIEVGIDQIVELAIPFDLLQVPVDGPVQFFVELLEGRQSRDRAPRDSTIDLVRPSEEFERIMWDV